MSDVQVPHAPTPLDVFRQTGVLWIAADEVSAFDDVIRMPLRNRSSLQSDVKGFLEFQRSVPDEASADVIRVAFDRMLENLHRGGEDVARLILWHLAISGMAPLSGPSAVPLMHWNAFISLIADGGDDAYGAHIDRAIIEQFAGSYQREVLEPSAALRERIVASRRAFLAAPDDRTAWDEYLYQYYFHRHDIAPSSFIDYDSVLSTAWWRRNGEALLTLDADATTSELVDQLQRLDEADIVDWEDVRPLSEALDVLDHIPVFEDHAREA